MGSLVVVSVIAFLNYKVLDWMLAQRRGGFCWYRPGRSPTDLLILAGVTIVIVIVLVAIWKEWKRRRQTAKCVSEGWENV